MSDLHDHIDLWNTAATLKACDRGLLGSNLCSQGLLAHSLCFSKRLDFSSELKLIELNMDEFSEFWVLLLSSLDVRECVLVRGGHLNPSLSEAPLSPRLFLG